MAGQVLSLINKLVDGRAKGNATVASTTRTKLLLKGIKAASWTPTSPDDPEMIARIQAVAKEMGVTI